IPAHANGERRKTHRGWISARWFAVRASEPSQVRLCTRLAPYKNLRFLQDFFPNLDRFFLVASTSSCHLGTNPHLTTTTPMTISPSRRANARHSVRPLRPRLELLEGRLVPAAGDLDLTFGAGNGRATAAFDLGGDKVDHAEGMAIDSQGRI